MAKPILLFIPHYIGSLKYFEKLIPYLEHKYDVGFLFLPKVKKIYLPEMINYCLKNNYKYYLIERYSPNKFLTKIPIYRTLAMLFCYKKQVKELLKDSRIKKFISSLDTNFYFHYLFDEANKVGIDTMVLQWAITTKFVIDKHIKQNNPSLRQKLTGILLKYITGLNPKKENFIGNGNSKKFGVINKQAYDLFKNAGVNEKKLSIVNYLDFYFARKTYRELDSDPQKKEKLMQRYNINPEKKNIIIYSTPFNTKDYARNTEFALSDNAQLAYYQDLIRMIRNDFNTDEADILFKIHPAEDINLYKPLEQQNVKLYGKDTVNEEIITVADLYIAHHSTTNFIPILTGKDAIFINFIGDKSIDFLKKHFGIKKFVSDKKEFQKLIADFKNNRLEKQYELTEEIYVPDSLNKIINWIG